MNAAAAGRIDDSNPSEDALSGPDPMARHCMDESDEERDETVRFEVNALCHSRRDDRGSGCGKTHLEDEHCVA